MAPETTGWRRQWPGVAGSRAGGSSAVRAMNRRSVANENQMRRWLRTFWPITASLKVPSAAQRRRLLGKHDNGHIVQRERTDLHGLKPMDSRLRIFTGDDVEFQDPIIRQRLLGQAKPPGQSRRDPL